LRIALLVILLLATRVARAEPPAVAVDFSPKVQPLLVKYCHACHGPDKEEGGVGLADIKDAASALRQRVLWKRAAKAIGTGDMPPADTKVQPTDAEKKLLTTWMKSAADFVDLDPASRDPGPALVRRLTRREYDNTIRDLLGVSFDSAAEAGLPDEDVVEGFDNNASSLVTSTTQLEKYLAAADKALDKVFATTPAKPTARDAKGSAKAPPGGVANPLERLLIAKPSATLQPRDAATQVLSNFVRRAYRRPAKPAELARLLPLFDRALAEGKPFDQSIRAALKPVLVSPHFLYRPETSRPVSAKGLGALVTDHELATRLSYFLWNTMPDDALLAAADAGQLSTPDGYAQQLARMLADPKARSLTDSFAAQWLHLNKIAFARPSTENFPTFTGKLRQAMADEIATFFDHLRTADRPIFDLLDADYTFANADLAKHYGIAGVSGPTAQRVALKSEHHRGGLLGMAGVLALTSHTHRTSPTQRGKFVLEVIFGTPPPPPPANVGQINENKKKGKSGKEEVASFRDLLAQHASQKSCAGCHAKIDPLGFAMDNYDAIGAWRTGTKDQPLDTTGVLPGGEKINGIDELKQVILSRKDEFARNLAEQLLSYALGRKLDYYDEPTLREIEAAMKKSEYKFPALVKAVAESYPFRNRRVEATKAAP